MNITFRTALISDLEKIVCTYNATIPGRMVTAELNAVTVESKLKWFNDHNENFRPLLIVEHENEYCGWISFNSFYGRAAYNGTAETSIYLEEKFQGKGIGKICLQKAIAMCAALKITSLLGFIFGHNEPSLQLYYKMGFEKWGHLPNVAKLDDKERDLIILGKRVG